MSRPVIFDPALGYTEEEWNSFSHQKRWRIRNPGNSGVKKNRRQTQLRRFYGMTLEDFDSMLKAQGGCCAICGTDRPGGRWNRFHVDHDHVTGKVRALLCHYCNNALGHLKDSVELCYKAAEYLKKWST